MPPLPTCAPIPHRSLISLTGAHATQFLHGILTLGPPVPAKGGFFTAFLHAQGRVLYDTFVFRQPNSQGTEDGYMIEYDSRPSSAPPLVSLLKRYILRSKVKVKDVSEEWDVWGAWGTETAPDDRKWRWGRSGAVEPVWDVEKWPWGGQDGHSILDRRAHGMGKRLLVRKGDQPSEASDHNVAASDLYTAHRISHGVPEGIIDIPPLQAFPMESNLDIMGALDFRKGCYVGQELTVRTYHTGVVRKRILPVKIHPLPESNAQTASLDIFPSVFIPGLDIKPVAVMTPEGRTPRPRGTGKLLSSVGNVGLALLRLEHVEGVSRGLANFELETGEEGQEKQRWRVTYLWPAGWPVQGINEIG